MKLTKEDIAFIAEMRAEGIKWKWLANAVYGVDFKALKMAFYYRMSAGFKKGDSNGY